MQTTRPPRAFTLVELIAVLVTLGILAGVALIAIPALVERARDTRAQVTLREIATAVLAQAALAGASELDRAGVTAAVVQTFHVDVVDVGSGAASTWYLGGKDFVPTGPDQFSVAFDNGDGLANDTGGTYAVLVTSTGARTHAQSVAWSANTPLDNTPAIPDRPNAEDYLDNDPPQPSPSPTGEVLGDGTPAPVPTPSSSPAPGSASAGFWSGFAIDDGWEVTVTSPAYGGTGPIVMTTKSPFTNRELTNQRVRTTVVCMDATQAARPVNSKDWESKAGNVTLEREYSCDDAGGFASLSIAPSGRLVIATGTYFPVGYPS